MSDQPTLLSVAEARARILEYFPALGMETVPISAAAGRVLAADVVATHAVPPFRNSSMDGYAVRAAETAGAMAAAPVRLRVSADIPAGAGEPCAHARDLEGRSYARREIARVVAEQTDHAATDRPASEQPDSYALLHTRDRSKGPRARAKDPRG